MSKMVNLVANKRGFTLTEVLIAIMILTIAIIAATNLLVNLRNSNQANMLTLQAYYHASSGIEAVRNIRDSNWLHNRDWLSEDSVAIWNSDFAVGNSYSVDLANGGLSQGAGAFGGGVQALSLASPFKVSAFSGENVVGVNGEPTIFSREILFEEYEEYQPNEAVLVTSKVSFELNGKEREVVLSEVLTNWKDGVF